MDDQIDLIVFHPEGSRDEGHRYGDHELGRRVNEIDRFESVRVSGTMIVGPGLGRSGPSVDLPRYSGCHHHHHPDHHDR